MLTSQVLKAVTEIILGNAHLHLEVLLITANFGVFNSFYLGSRSQGEYCGFQVTATIEGFQVLVCLPLISGQFSPKAGDQIFYFFIAKSTKRAGNFVVCSLKVGMEAIQ